MAQSKLNDLAGRFGKGPKGLGTGLKVLAGAAVAAYGVSQSMYTGKSCLTTYCSQTHFSCMPAVLSWFVPVENSCAYPRLRSVQLHQREWMHQRTLCTITDCDNQNIIIKVSGFELLFYGF
jgi:hypothetical protein